MSSDLRFAVNRRGRTTVSRSAFRLSEINLDTSLRAAVVVLWLLCSAYWAIISYTVSGWLIPAGLAEIAEAGFMPVGLRLIVVGSLLIGGMFALSCLAFAKRQPQTIEVAGYQLELPARRSTGRSDRAERGMTALQLAGGLAALCVLVAVLVRFG